MPSDLSIVNEILCDMYGIESWQIGKGYCYIWAYLVKLIFPEAILQYNHKHAWVCIDGEYFDSRYLWGASAITRITYFGIIDDNASTERFIEYWSSHGKLKEELRNVIV